MKAVLIFILAIFINSCCGTQQVIETQPEPSKEIAIVTEVPDAIEATSGSEQPEPEGPLKIEDEKNDDDDDEIIVLEAFDHSIFDELLQKNVSEIGSANYKGFKTEADLLRGYIKVLGMFMPTEDWSKEDKLAYWINAYNALTIDLIIRNYPIESIKDIKNPWDQRLWKFGNKWQNLNDIEHKILRKMNEPRIHFAIVCASKSCPKLLNKAFTSENLEEQLTKVTTDFLFDTSKNELSKNRIKLSKIFKWFKKDFEENGSLIDFINQYSEVSISDKAKKSFKDYDWDLND